jgi:hypothetical protein
MPALRTPRLTAVALVAAAILGLGTTVATPKASAALDFHLSTQPTGTPPIAGDFLGLALEYRSIPPMVGTDPQAVNPLLLQLIRGLVPDGRPSLRIGGQSADRTWWPVAGMAQPLGITYRLSPDWMARARGLATALDARLILGLGLEANRSRIDAVEANELLQGIGRRYIDAFEIGNEPELYPLIPWYRRLGSRPIPWYSTDGTPVYSRRPGYGPAQFESEFARTLAAVPATPIAGPDTGTLPELEAFNRFISPSSRVRVVTWHAYGLNECITDPHSAFYPTVPNLLSRPASRDFDAGIGPFLSHAHRSGAAFRIDEMGSVTCNGRAGVSNTFATALWAVDALFQAASDGVDGVNLHTYPGSVNGLFDFTRSHGQWLANVHPLYYGALMFARAAPAGSRLLPVTSPNPGAVRAWATRAPDGRIRVVLINDGMTYPAHVVLSVPGHPPVATIGRLLGPSPYATGGVRLGGASFGAASPRGTLPALTLPTVTPHGGSYAVTVPPASAALLTLGGGPGTGPAPDPADDASQLRRASGFWMKLVIRLNSATRSWISSLVSRATRSVPNSSTLNDASAVP